MAIEDARIATEGARLAASCDAIAALRARSNENQASFKVRNEQFEQTKERHARHDAAEAAARVAEDAAARIDRLERQLEDARIHRDDANTAAARRRRRCR